MLTYSELQEQVATDLGNRQDLLLPIPPSTVALIPTTIQRRISFYAKFLYAPGQQLDYSVIGIVGRSTYPLPYGMQSLERVRVQNGSIWIPMTRRTYDWILEVDCVNPPITSIPVEFAQRGQALRVFPSPNQTYPFELMGTNSPPPPEAPGDRNFWTDNGPTGAAELIINSTCADLWRRPINNPARANECEALAQREALALQEYTQRVNGPTIIDGYI